MVTRYEVVWVCHGYGCQNGLERDEEGDYVEYEDYYKLQTMLAEVTLRLENYIEADYPEYLLEYPKYQARLEGELEIITEARKMLEGL